MNHDFRRTNQDCKHEFDLIIPYEEIANVKCPRCGEPAIKIFKTMSFARSCRGFYGKDKT